MATSPKSGSAAPRRKGCSFEREIVAALQELGITAEQVPFSGAVKRSRFDHHVSCPARGVDRRLECKRRPRAAFATIDNMLDDKFAVIGRNDRSRPLVLTTFASFAELAIYKRASCSPTRGGVSGA